jgi:hypothetical protein
MHGMDWILGAFPQLVDAGDFIQFPTQEKWKILKKDINI